MPSIKSHLVALVLKHTRKKAFRSAEAFRDRVAAARRLEDHRPPRAIATMLDIEETAIDGFPVYDVSPRAPVGTRRLLYLHGGAYCFQMTAYHWGLVAEMATRLACKVTVPIYPLAPEHDFHAMLAMVMSTYRAMLEATPSRDIVFMGDSAGGNMALVVTMTAAEAGMPLPARHVLISPGTDMTVTNPETRAAALTDPWLGIPGGLEAVRLYCAGIDVADWQISPIHGDLSVLPPTIILSGTRDLLYPDTLLFVEKARRAGVEIELVTGKGMIHVWPLIEMPETRMARDRIVAWLQAGDAAPAASGRQLKSVPSA
ncbi:alpha/beta hydrolase [Mesorhizobium xinjiangense]|uniref:alpha/beta hydrolase n=1 Tax=Mesorhizobium xinjiangense TaxID=2678685 RepID=UPI0012EEC0A7|nr:alpha/beta hydrolase [Mesorhizobium xinjiangense]